MVSSVTAAEYYVRAAQLDYMWDLARRVEACAEGAATATGCNLRSIRMERPYEPMKRNAALLDAFRANMASQGIEESPEITDRLGSSDIGNVSQILPTIQPLVQIAPAGTPIHSRLFEAAAAAPLARDGMLKAAATMAMTTLDLLADPALLQRAKREFVSPR